MKRITTVAAQVLLIHLFLVLAIAIKSVISIPLPSTIIGIFLLFFSLVFNLVKLDWVETGGKWLMAELLLFFIPSAVGIIDYNEIFSLQGLLIIIVILLSTLLVMSVTALIAERLEVSKS